MKQAFKYYIVGLAIASVLTALLAFAMPSKGLYLDVAKVILKQK